MKNRDDMKPNDREISRKRRNSSNSNCSNSKIQRDLEELQFAKKGHGIEGNDSLLLDDNDLLTLSLTFGQEKSKRTATMPSSSPPLSSPFPPEQEFMPQSLPSQTLTAPLTYPLPLSSSLSLMAATSPPIIDAPQLETLSAAPPPTGLSSILAAAAPSLMPDQPPVYPSSHRREIPTPRTSRPPRARRSHAQTPREENKPFLPPFPWAAKRAAVYSLEELMAKKIEIITGLVQCKKCEKQYEMGFNLREKFLEVGSFIADNKESMHDRAPNVWMSPVLPTCKFCEQENSVKPVISEKKKAINWLFLLLGQMLGCCTLDQLKYFCKHTDNHRTGAKDRVLYLTYLGLCKQLDPTGPFDR